MKRLLFAFIFIFSAFLLNGQAIGDYQSAASGNWSLLATWQTWNGSAWVAAAATPTSANGIITIQAGHTVTINISGLSIDDVIVNGTLQTGTASPAANFTIANGTGVDLTVNGTFIDNLTTGVITWAGTWQYGPTGTLVKTAGSSAANWQINYNGGNTTMPATANWIMRKANAQQPALVTTSPASGSVYPNLIIENNTGAAWVTPVGSSFTGLAAFPTVKGNLDIGGAGTNTVDFLNSNTNASPLLVNGNVTIRNGCNYRNYGTGIEIQGNITVNGSITYDANDARKIVFSGGNNQTINGAGSMGIWDMTLNKSAGTVTLNRAITVDNLSTFTGGIMISTSTNLLNIAATGTVAGANNSSFVSGPVRYYGNNAFTFPVGKNTDYQPLAISAFAPTGGVFWTENFGVGCSQNQLESGYTGPNGTWTQSQQSANGTSANDWFISATEAGMGVGNCGNGCLSNGALTNRTLHVGCRPVALFCPTGDCGAAYNAGPSGGTVITDRRAESPSINCTGRTGITLSFAYIETGAAPNDAGSVWYYDGTTWSLLSIPPVTVNTGCLGQGRWTSYSIALPASADNNPNVKIGFRWVNNDDGGGTDPPMAVDDIQLSMAGTSFTAEYFYANPQVVYNNNLAPTLSVISACEYWVLDRLPLNSTAATAVTLTWDGNSCPAIPMISDTRVAHFDLTTWQDEGNGGNTGTTAAGTVTSAAPVTYFSPFTIGLIPPTPLPIEMLNFSGTCGDNVVELKWSTASETNNDYFTIERSTDGINFSAIGTVTGGGNSTAVLHYHFTDADAMAGTNYYRIRQTDFNGQFSYGKIIAVDTKDCGNKNLVVVHSFFNGNDLEIDYRHSAAPVTIEIYSQEGKLVCRYLDEETDADFHIDATSWGKALYFYRVSDGITSASGTLLR